jgi:hypothetical protein
MILSFASYKKINSNDPLKRRVAMVSSGSGREVLGSNPHCGDRFSGTILLDQSLEIN